MASKRTNEGEILLSDDQNSTEDQNKKPAKVVRKAVFQKDYKKGVTVSNPVSICVSPLGSNKGTDSNEDTTENSMYKMVHQPEKKNQPNTEPVTPR